MTHLRLATVLATGAILFVTGQALYPNYWRLTSYLLLRDTINSGDEDASLRTLQVLAEKRHFEPNWTPTEIIPCLQWVHQLDNWASRFGFYRGLCPSCSVTRLNPLCLAARKGNARLVTTLIKSGASVSSNNDQGYLALGYAVFSGNTNVVATLIAHDGNVNARVGTFYLLQIAVLSCRDPDLIQYLLEEGADPNVTDPRGWTVLDAASIWNTNAIPLLTAYGAISGTNRSVELPKAAR